MLQQNNGVNKLTGFLVIISSVMAMLCLGGIYAWSFLVPYLKGSLHFSTAQTQILFGFTIAVFSVTMFFSGKIEKKIGPRKTTLISALLFAVGYIFAWLSKGSFALVFLGVSVLSGISIGFGYVASLATPVKWFPQHKGLVTGISVAGFGCGAVLFTYIAQKLFNQNMSVLQVLLYIGIAYGLIIALSSVYMIAPEQKTDEKQKDPQKEDCPSPLEFIKNKNIRLLALGMCCGTFAGLLIIGNLKSIALDLGISVAIANLSIGLLAIGNTLGRVAWGFMSDRIGSRKSIIIFLTLLAAAVLMLIPNPLTKSIFLLIVIMIGLNFGANFVLFAAEVTNVFGINKLTLVYPYIFLFYGIAGIIGPIIGGYIYDMTHSYNISIIIAASLCIASAAIFKFVYPAQSKNEG